MKPEELEPAIKDMGNEITVIKRKLRDKDFELFKDMRKIKILLLKIEKRVVWCEENIKSNMLRKWNKEDTDNGVEDYAN